MTSSTHNSPSTSGDDTASEAFNSKKWLELYTPWTAHTIDLEDPKENPRGFTLPEIFWNGVHDYKDNTAFTFFNKSVTYKDFGRHVATAAAGPIAFVAFLCGPIAARLVGPNGSLLLPSALVGALLVLVADLVGQFLLGTRFPVGVVTGVLGAPYLVYLIVRTNRAGGSL